ncbi:MAG: FtsB family cell division protein [Thermodesulfobacteriota bacterium]
MLANLPPHDRKMVIISSAVAIALALGWTVFGPYGALKYSQTALELHEVQNENERLRGDNEALQQEIKRLKSDPAYLEEVARQQFGLIKKNEVVFEFPEKKKRHE